MARKVLTQNLSQPLGGARAAKVEIDMVDGHLTVDGFSGGESLLASGALQYMENQEVPSLAAETSNGRVMLAFKTGGRGQSWFHFPWQRYSRDTEWQIHLNPNVQSEIAAHTGGGNVRLDLGKLAITSVSADTGGGNMELVLPEHAAGLNVSASSGGGSVTVEIGDDTRGSNTVNAGSGAGNVVVRVPSGLAARIHVGSGWGKEIVDSQFSKIDDHTYQSPDYDRAVDKVEITAKSGAGDVRVDSK